MRTTTTGYLPAALVLLATSGAGSAATATERYVAPGGADGTACTDPANPCASIQYAADQAASGDVIHLAAGVYLETPVIDGDVTIIGAGSSATIIDGQALDTVFHVTGTLALSRVTVTNGRGDLGGGFHVTGRLALDDAIVEGNTAELFGGGLMLSCRGRDVTITRSIIRDNVAEEPFGNGGGINVNSCTDLVLVDSTVRGNRARIGGGVLSLHRFEARGSTIADNAAADGGGVYVSSSQVHCMPAVPEMRLVNTTVSGNTADFGGGIAISDSLGDNRTVLKNVTIAFNRATREGGGIDFYADRQFEMSNSVVADNTAPVGPDCFADQSHPGSHNLIADPSGCTLTGAAGELVGVDPQLAPLADNGGPSQTHAVAAGSPAVDAGDPAGCRDADAMPLAVDQRGYPRTVDCGVALRCDLGAFEACNGTGPSVYESRVPWDVAQPANAVGSAAASPYDHAPSGGDLLFYQVGDDPAAATIRLVAGGSGVLIHF